jgi:hypothetical protein
MHRGARTDLCGGRGVTRVPTATRKENPLTSESLSDSRDSRICWSCQPNWRSDRALRLTSLCLGNLGIGQNREVDMRRDAAQSGYQCAISPDRSEAKRLEMDGFTEHHVRRIPFRGNPG